MDQRKIKPCLPDERLRSISDYNLLGGGIMKMVFELRGTGRMNITVGNNFADFSRKNCFFTKSDNLRAKYSVLFSIIRQNGLARPLFPTAGGGGISPLRRYVACKVRAA